MEKKVLQEKIKKARGGVKITKAYYAERAHSIIPGNKQTTMHSVQWYNTGYNIIIVCVSIDWN